MLQELYNIFQVIAIFGIIIIVMLYLKQNSILYAPDAAGMMNKAVKSNPINYRSPKERGMNFENVWINTKDKQRLHGWLIFHKNSTQLPTLIYFNGNAGNIGMRLDRVELFFKLFKINILIVDYSGYGSSTGTPSEDGLLLDAEATILFTKDNAKIDKQQIFIYGKSLGGGVAIYLGEKFGSLIQGIILENTFMNIPELVDHYYPLLRPIKRFLLKLKWYNDVRIRKVTRPILFITGANDEIIPTIHSHNLRAQATSSIYTDLISIPGGDHNECFKIGKEIYFEKIKIFIDFVLKVKKQSIVDSWADTNSTTDSFKDK